MTMPLANYIISLSFPAEMPDVARKLKIKDIVGAKFVKSDDEPNHIVIGDLKASKINLIAVTVGSEEAGIVLDDGTGRIEARFSDMQRPALGDVVLMIARPREFNQTIYLVPEIIRKISPAWLEFRRKEISDQSFSRTERLLKVIQRLDKGSGADVEDIKSTVPESDKLISMLLESGDIFEVKPGRLKVLE